MRNADTADLGVALRFFQGLCRFIVAVALGFGLTQGLGHMYRLFAMDVGRLLVFAETLERGVAQPAVGRPFGELNLANQVRLYPGRAALAIGGHRVKGHGLDRAIVQECPHLKRGFRVEAGADLAGIDQFFFGIISEQKRAYAASATLGLGKAANDKLLALVALDLQPVAIAAGAVTGVGAFADNPLIGQAADVFQHIGLVGEMLAVQHPIAGLVLVQKRFEPPFALQQGQVAQIFAIELQEVENVILQVLAATMAQLVLQGLEAGRALVVERHDLAVEDRRLHPKRAQIFRQGLELGCPVKPGPRQHPRPSTFDQGHCAIPVELDLVHPVGAGRHGVDQGG